MGLAVFFEEVGDFFLKEVDLVANVLGILEIIV